MELLFNTNIYLLIYLTLKRIYESIIICHFLLLYRSYCFAIRLTFAFCTKHVRLRRHLRRAGRSDFQLPSDGFPVCLSRSIVRESFPKHQPVMYANQTSSLSFPQGARELSSIHTLAGLRSAKARMSGLVWHSFWKVCSTS